MDNLKKATIKNFVLPIALIAGVSRMLLDIIPKTLSLGPIAYYSTFVLAFIAEIILIVVLMKKFKAKNEGYLTLKEGILLGITTMLVIGIIYSVSSFVYDSYIDPDFQINTAIAWGEMFGQGDVVREQIENNPPQKSYLGIPLSILWFSFIGFLVSMISASVLKKEPNSF